MKKIAILLILAVLCGLGYYSFYPNVSKLKKENPKKTALMEIREHEWRSKGKKVVLRQKWVPLRSVSPYLVKAVLIAEDDKFWSHSGFDIDAMQKALEKDLKEKKLRFGGSTISQQLAKNLYLSPSKNPLRKVKEAIITWRLERTLAKKRILEIYLNVAEWERASSALKPPPGGTTGSLHHCSGPTRQHASPRSFPIRGGFGWTPIPGMWKRGAGSSTMSW